MLVFGDRVRTEDPQEKLEAIAAGTEAAARMPPGLQRHAALVELLISAGELAQGLADAEFAERGFDHDSPLQTAAMTLTLGHGHAVDRSWRSGFSHYQSAAAEGLAALRRLDLPPTVRTVAAEGYGLYAVYPESYLLAARASAWSGPPAVIGLRSIGASLAAMVSIATGAPPPITVRPHGPPFDRRVTLSPELETRLARADGYAIVDEGPGLSGSSFGAVGDLLARLGAPADRIVYFPSHGGPPGERAKARHRQRWAQARRQTVDFDALSLRAAQPAHRLETWFADLAGAATAPLEDLSAAGWRMRLAPAARPPAHPAQERRKFILRTDSGPLLLKFAGLGDEGRRKFDQARTLHAAGFTPQPLGLRHGFLAERWLEAALPLRIDTVDRDRLLARLGGYIAFRTRHFPAAAGAGADLAQFMEMAATNIGEALGNELADRTTERVRAIGAAAEATRRIHTDNRLHAWEWIDAGPRGILKTDALDHASSHDLVGCQDAAWDIAGAAVEFDLSDDEAERLRRFVEEGSGHRVSPARLAACAIFYPAFQIGLWTLAAQGADAEARPAIQDLLARYARRLAEEGERAWT